MRPNGNIRGFFAHVCPQILKIRSPNHWTSFIFKILFENGRPFLTRDVVCEVFGSLIVVHFVNRHIYSCLDIAFKFLVCFIVLVVQWSSIQVDNTCAPFHVINCSSQGNFCTEPVSTECCHCQFFVIHKFYHVFRNILATKNLDYHVYICLLTVISKLGWWSDVPMFLVFNNQTFLTSSTLLSGLLKNA